jgi:hypothetical protein
MKQNDLIEEDNSRQDFFISNDGYINIRLKVTTEDRIARECIIYELMSKVYKNEGFEMPKNVSVDQLYFHNQNPLTVLKDMKAQILDQVESMFDGLINK